MPAQTNPEAELLNSQIAHERRYLRHRGITAIILWLAALILTGWMAINFWIIHPNWLTPLLCGVCIFFGYLAFRGFNDYRTGKSPATQEEIAYRRQSDRMYLFQTALGHIPPQWRPLSLFTNSFLSILIVITGIWSIIANSRDNLIGALLLIILGLCLCGFTLIEWRRAHRLQTTSRAMLAERLQNGENTQ
jgi:fatty acid desaturase